MTFTVVQVKPKPENTPQRTPNLSWDKSIWKQGLLLSRSHHNNIQATPQQTDSLGTISPHTITTIARTHPSRNHQTIHAVCTNTLSREGHFRLRGYLAVIVLYSIVGFYSTENTVVDKGFLTGLDYYCVLKAGLININLIMWWFIYFLLCSEHNHIICWLWHRLCCELKPLNCPEFTFVTFPL